MRALVKGGLTGLLAALVAGIIAGCGGSSGPTAVNWYVFPEPSGSFQAAASECSANSHGAYNIKINFLSTSSDQQRVSLVRRLAASDSASIASRQPSPLRQARDLE